MSEIEMAAKIRALKELEALIEEAESEAESIRDELKAQMIEEGVEEKSVDVYKVRYKEVVSSRFDSSKFKSEHSDLYEQFSKHVKSRRFTIS